jgi:hypothetical protein
MFKNENYHSNCATFALPLKRAFDAEIFKNGHSAEIHSSM